MKKVLRNIYLVVKRIIDIIFASILLILLFIPFLIVGLAIKIEDKGPVFYTQDRVGKNLKLFKIYKFRSMKTNRKELDSNMSHEEMVTKVGKFIRKTSIDELPQLINILKGEMSFIGPRPWIPEYYEFFTEEQKRRSDVLPGISGLAQVKGRNKINIFKKINYDIEYVDNISPLMDIKIILLTILEVLRKTGAEASEQDIMTEINELRTKKTKSQ
ncbi:MAG: sugar transferase [Clostridia bacterium]